ncbi:response regulator [Paucisalibacillus globulus]|uniref:response regulator n=1 Tax=Paucisalibacillus globulus TaxID=351095 RepID=UPI00041578B6|nr:response regulator [Paucisalibacillus globulus]
MIQVLIVDDEQIEREGMKAILHQSFPSLVLLEARNGSAAIERAKTSKPELILMDIKMPGINGLEALAQIMKECPDAKFIMVTAYDTFDYMRKAIKLGASDYLLKPSKASDIIETVGKVLKEIVFERKSRAKTELQQSVLQQTRTVIETDLVTQLLFEHIHEVSSNILAQILEINTAKEMFVVNVMIKGSTTSYSMVKERVRRSGNCLVGALSSSQLPIIVFRNSAVSFRSQAISLSKEILSVKKITDEGWYIGIGNVYPTLADVKKSYQESLIAMMGKTAPSRYRFYAEILVEGDRSLEQKVKQIKEEIPDQIRLGQWDLVRTVIIGLLELFEHQGENPIQVQQRILEILWVVSHVLNDVGIEADTPLFTYQPNDYLQLRNETGKLIDQMRDRYDAYYQRLEADNVEQIKRYIMEHSHEEISLETLGKRMGLSPIYISKLFKEKLGINYIDFLTKCRIEKAKNLMRDPKKSIKEIAIEVGYHEPNYFSKVFKRTVHVSPKEYQNAILGKWKRMRKY